MGCSAAKNIPIEPLDGHLTNGHSIQSRTVPISPKNHPVLPPLEAEDIQAELLENSTVNNVHRGANGLSFDIAFDEEDDNQKKPPKRLLERLEGPVPTPSLQQLQEKLEEAEVRRQQILAQRVQSAKLRNQMKKSNNESFDEDEDGVDGFLKVPKESTVRPSNPYDVSYV